MDQVRVGVIGCGKISGHYFKGCREFPILDVVACADLLPERARAQAEEFGIARVLPPEELLADDAVELVVNLTIPAAHHAVSRAAIAAGKHVWSEKPLAVERGEGEDLVRAATAAGVLLGCAPDTFLGGGHQTCRKLLDDGWIGTPLHAVAFMAGPGPESWHADPAFFYQRGGGPMFDVGPYSLTCLVHLLGPVRSVAGLTRITHPERLITSEPHYGERITVEVPTHVQGLLQFAGGAQALILTSFDVQAANLPALEIYGSEGSLAVPDPNGPAGPVSPGPRPRGVGAGAPEPRPHRNQPRPRGGGPGLCRAPRPPAACRRGAGAARAGHHARHPRSGGGRSPGGAHHHLRASRAPAPGPAARRAGLTARAPGRLSALSARSRSQSCSGRRW